jgi:pimeloyl-ACP methyl ester carboxylesterase
MGGYVAFELYRQAPALFRGLALCDTRPGADGAEGKASREQFAKHALERGLGWVADEMMPKLVRPDADPRVVKEVRDLIRHGTEINLIVYFKGLQRHLQGDVVKPVFL